MVTIELKFDFAQQVTIKELGLTGWILSMWYGRRGMEYEVRYLSNGEYKSTYFYECELEDA